MPPADYMFPLPVKRGNAGRLLLEDDGAEEIVFVGARDVLHIGDETGPLLFLPDITALVVGHFENTAAVENIGKLFGSCIHSIAFYYRDLLFRFVFLVRVVGRSGVLAL